MNYTVKIESVNGAREIEWIEEINSNASMRGARQRATNWINRNLFTDEIGEIEKRQIGQRLEYWRLR